MLDDVDLLVCGAGPVGCVVAERAANVLGWKVLVVDRRPHVAGNCYDAPHRNGVLVHKYGPHYFRTNDPDLIRHLGRYTEWIDAKYEVRSYVGGRLYPFPINLTTLERYHERDLNDRSAEQLLDEKREHHATPRDSEEYVVNRVGREMYKSFYRDYTRKQWGREPRELDAGVCGRVPVRLDRDTRYVNHRFQVMPRNGFTAMFARMLKHRKIRLLLDADFAELRQLVRPRRATVYTGPIDDYFGRRFGSLPYRSLRFEFREYDTRLVQPCVQINYPNDFAFTRSVEVKHITSQRHPGTVVSYETPAATGEPYYPVPRPESRALYERYRELADIERATNNVYFCGRLAQYRYFNTDEVIHEALQCFQQIRRNHAAPAPYASSPTAA